MQISTICGKGGVGKSTTAAALALWLSQKKRTLIFDYDAGHSIKENFGIDEDLTFNALHHIGTNLTLSIIENQDFKSISTFEKAKDRYNEYAKQFPRDHGLVSIADMMTEFFGFPADVPTVQKFILLIDMLLEAKGNGMEQIVIDVEPTAGLERLLSNSEKMARSLRNLKEKSWLLLKLVSLYWEDVAQSLKSDYIKNIDVFTERIEEVVALLKSANYFLICTPERIPVKQSFDVNKIIRKFGGVPCGYIVNNIRNEPHEKEHLATIHQRGLPVLEIPRHAGLHGANNEVRRAILLEIGEKVECLKSFT